MMMGLLDKKNIMQYVKLALLLLVLLLPIRANAQAQNNLAQNNLLTALFGSGGGSGSGSGDVIPRFSQVIPALNGLLDASRNDRAGTLEAFKLQTETDRKRTDAQIYAAHNDRRLEHDDEIRSHYPELSNLACGIATINQSVPAIELASQNATAQVIDILTNGMYQSLISGTAVAAKRKHDIWCKLGAVADDDKCTSDPLIVGCDRDRHSCMARKDSIPCNMQAVQQEFVKMANEGYTPAREHRECIAAILSIANEFEQSNALPTKEELKTTQGIIIRGEKKNAIAREWATKGSALQEFADIVSVDESSAPDCKKACAGSNDVCSILRKVYGNAMRPNGVAPYGLPGNGYCLSPFQIAWGKELAIDQSTREDIGKLNWQQAMIVNAMISREQLKPRRERRYSIKPNTAGFGHTNEISARPVAISNNNDDLLGAIRQLTREIQKMNTGVYANTLQEASVKKRSKRGAPASPITAPTSSTPDEISDALKEMGIKVSAPAAGGVLPPITQEFPALPAQ